MFNSRASNRSTRPYTLYQPSPSVHTSPGRQSFAGVNMLTTRPSLNHRPDPIDMRNQFLGKTDTANTQQNIISAVRDSVNVSRNLQSAFYTNSQQNSPHDHDDSPTFGIQPWSQIHRWGLPSQESATRDCINRPIVYSQGLHSSSTTATGLPSLASHTRIVQSGSSLTQSINSQHLSTTGMLSPDAPYRSTGDAFMYTPNIHSNRNPYVNQFCQGANLQYSKFQNINFPLKMVNDHCTLKENSTATNMISDPKYESHSIGTENLYASVNGCLMHMRPGSDSCPPCCALPCCESDSAYCQQGQKHSSIVINGGCADSRTNVVINQGPMPVGGSIINNTVSGSNKPTQSNAHSLLQQCPRKTAEYENPVHTYMTSDKVSTDHFQANASESTCMNPQSEEPHLTGNALSYAPLNSRDKENVLYYPTGRIPENSNSILAFKILKDINNCSKETNINSTSQYDTKLNSYNFRNLSPELLKTNKKSPNKKEVDADNLNISIIYASQSPVTQPKMSNQSSYSGHHSPSQIGVANMGNNCPDLSKMSQSVGVFHTEINIERPIALPKIPKYQQGTPGSRPPGMDGNSCAGSTRSKSNLLRKLLAMCNELETRTAHNPGSRSCESEILETGSDNTSARNTKAPESLGSDFNNNVISENIVTSSVGAENELQLGLKMRTSKERMSKLYHHTKSTERCIEDDSNCDSKCTSSNNTFTRIRDYQNCEIVKECSYDTPNGTDVENSGYTYVIVDSNKTNKLESTCNYSGNSLKTDEVLNGSMTQTVADTDTRVGTTDSSVDKAEPTFTYVLLSDTEDTSDETPKFTYVLLSDDEIMCADKTVEQENGNEVENNDVGKLTTLNAIEEHMYIEDNLKSNRSNHINRNNNKANNDCETTKNLSEKGPANIAVHSKSYEKCQHRNTTRASIIDVSDSDASTISASEDSNISSSTFLYSDSCDSESSSASGCKQKRDNLRKKNWKLYEKSDTFDYSNSNLTLHGITKKSSRKLTTGSKSNYKLRKMAASKQQLSPYTTSPIEGNALTDNVSLPSSLDISIMEELTGNELQLDLKNHRQSRRLTCRQRPDYSMIVQQRPPTSRFHQAKKDLPEKDKLQEEISAPNYFKTLSEEAGSCKSNENHTTLKSRRQCPEKLKEMKGQDITHDANDLSRELDQFMLRRKMRSTALESFSTSLTESVRLNLPGNTFASDLNDIYGEALSNSRDMSNAIDNRDSDADGMDDSEVQNKIMCDINSVVNSKPIEMMDTSDQSEQHPIHTNVNFVYERDLRQTDIRSWVKQSHKIDSGKPTIAFIQPTESPMPVLSKVNGLRQNNTDCLESNEMCRKETNNNLMHDSSIGLMPVDHLCSDQLEDNNGVGNFLESQYLYTAYLLPDKQTSAETGNDLSNSYTDSDSSEHINAVHLHKPSVEQTDKETNLVKYVSANQMSFRRNEHKAQAKQSSELSTMGKSNKLALEQINIGKSNEFAVEPIANGKSDEPSVKHVCKRGELPNNQINYAQSNSDQGKQTNVQNTLTRQVLKDCKGLNEYEDELTPSGERNKHGFENVFLDFINLKKSVKERTNNCSNKMNKKAIKHQHRVEKYRTTNYHRSKKRQLAMLALILSAGMKPPSQWLLESCSDGSTTESDEEEYATHREIVRRLKLDSAEMRGRNKGVEEHDSSDVRMEIHDQTGACKILKDAMCQTEDHIHEPIENTGEKEEQDEVIGEKTNNETYKSKEFILERNTDLTCDNSNSYKSHSDSEEEHSHAAMNLPAKASSILVADHFTNELKQNSQRAMKSLRPRMCSKKHSNRTSRNNHSVTQPRQKNIMKHTLLSDKQLRSEHVLEPTGISTERLETTKYVGHRNRASDVQISLKLLRCDENESPVVMSRGTDNNYKSNKGQKNTTQSSYCSSSRKVSDLLSPSEYILSPRCRRKAARTSSTTRLSTRRVPVSSVDNKCITRNCNMKLKTKAAMCLLASIENHNRFYKANECSVEGIQNKKLDEECPSQTCCNSNGVDDSIRTFGYNGKRRNTTVTKSSDRKKSDNKSRQTQGEERVLDGDTQKYNTKHVNVGKSSSNFRRITRSCLSRNVEISQQRIDSGKLHETQCLFCHRLLKNKHYLKLHLKWCKLSPNYKSVEYRVNKNGKSSKMTHLLRKSWNTIRNWNRISTSTNCVLSALEDVENECAIQENQQSLKDNGQGPKPSSYLEYDQDSPIVRPKTLVVQMRRENIQKMVDENNAKDVENNPTIETAAKKRVSAIDPATKADIGKINRKKVTDSQTWTRQSFYKCSRCKYSTSNRRGYDKHLYYHTTRESRTCVPCNRLFGSLQSYRYFHTLNKLNHECVENTDQEAGDIDSPGINANKDGKIISGLDNGHKDESVDVIFGEQADSVFETETISDGPFLKGATEPFLKAATEIHVQRITEANGEESVIAIVENASGDSDDDFNETNSYIVSLEPDNNVNEPNHSDVNIPLEYVELKSEFSTMKTEDNVMNMDYNYGYETSTCISNMPADPYAIKCAYCGLSVFSFEELNLHVVDNHTPHRDNREVKHPKNHSMYYDHSMGVDGNNNTAMDLSFKKCGEDSLGTCKIPSTTQSENVFFEANETENLNISNVDVKIKIELDANFDSSERKYYGGNGQDPVWNNAVEHEPTGSNGANKENLENARNDKTNTGNMRINSSSSNSDDFIKREPGDGDDDKANNNNPNPNDSSSKTKDTELLLCLICHTSFSIKADLLKHLVKVHKLTNLCQLCYFSDGEITKFANAVSLRNHKLRYHPQDMVLCVCGSLLIDEKMLLSHQRKFKCIENGNNDMVKCVCGKRFINNDMLLAHQSKCRRRHTSDEMEQRNICIKRGKSRSRRNSATSNNDSTFKDIKQNFDHYDYMAPSTSGSVSSTSKRSRSYTPVCKSSDAVNNNLLSAIKTQLDTKASATPQRKSKTSSSKKRKTSSKVEDLQNNNFTPKRLFGMDIAVKGTPISTKMSIQALRALRDNSNTNIGNSGDGSESYNAVKPNKPAADITPCSVTPTPAVSMTSAGAASQTNESKDTVPRTGKEVIKTGKAKDKAKPAKKKGRKCAKPDEEGRYPCKVCRRRFKRPYLYVHQKWYHQKKQWILVPTSWTKPRKGKR